MAAVVLATAGCSEVIDPSTANMTGIFVRVDSSSSQGLRLGVRSNNQYLVALPPDYIDYYVTVTGKIFIQAAGGYRQIGITEVPLNSGHTMPRAFRSSSAAASAAREETSSLRTSSAFQTRFSSRTSSAVTYRARQWRPKGVRHISHRAG